VRKGRDGCRVPLPWTREGAGLGFTAGRPWLPQPADWGGRSVEAQSGDPGSMLELTRRALALRPGGGLAWRESPPGTLVFSRDGVVCAVNVSAPSLPLPAGELLLASAADVRDVLLPARAAWIAAPE
jgi:alpha-glucosidase